MLPSSLVGIALRDLFLIATKSTESSAKKSGLNQGPARFIETLSAYSAGSGAGKASAACLAAASRLARNCWSRLFATLRI